MSPAASLVVAGCGWPPFMSASRIVLAWQSKLLPAHGQRLASDVQILSPLDSIRGERTTTSLHVIVKCVLPGQWHKVS